MTAKVGDTGSLDDNEHPKCPHCGKKGLGYPGDWGNGGGIECSECGTVIEAQPETTWRYEILELPCK